MQPEPEHKHQSKYPCRHERVQWPTGTGMGKGTFPQLIHQLCQLGLWGKEVCKDKNENEEEEKYDEDVKKKE